MDSELHPPHSIGSHSISDWDPITGDASGRQYWRVTLAPGGSAVLCRYPDNMRSLVSRDLEVLIWLRQQGIPVPRVIAGKASSPWVLLEDLGQVDGEEELKNSDPSSRAARTIAYLQPLIRLSALPVDRLPCWNPDFDIGYLRWELTGFEMWGLPGSHRPARNSALAAWLDDLARTVADHPRTICLRDFHLNNILVDAKGDVGIIDVQDLRQGPDTYDLASLLWDRSMPELLAVDGQATVAHQWARSVNATSGWEIRLQETTLQRSLKVLGTFAFLQSQGLSNYRRWVPKTASTAVFFAQKLGAPAEVIAILLDLAATGGFDVW